MRRRNRWRWRRRSERERITPPWMGPLVEGPVVFDASVRTAGELSAKTAHTAPVVRHRHAA